ncbi:MAG: hypothetical protein CMO98_06415 [Woeseia sp.]|nr:hypothetical protein [Woeseia sp.]|tara:strand:+ start:2159 stop:3418 length:1260 start_codon:yes stop_codon:yes gene_type:complete
MDISATGLQRQPFHTDGDPLVFFSYSGQEKAYEFFEETWHQNTGLGLFQGPHLSGKSTIISHYKKLIADDCAVAVVNGDGIDSNRLLAAMLKSFGYQHEFETLNELMNMVIVFIKQQTAAGRPPMLFVENTHAMSPDAMNTLCELSAIHVKDKFALRIILASDRSIAYIANAPAMGRIAKRLTGNFHLAPLTIDEASDYLYTKLKQGGCADPDIVFPDAVCDELYHSSGGWPGLLDELAASAIERADQCPVRPNDVGDPSAPKGTHPALMQDATLDAEDRSHSDPIIFLTHNGETLKKIRFEGSRLLIGRSSHNDLQIDGKFLSRHHALLVRHGPATLLMDLNSANGTFVNSRRVSNQVLMHDDVITLGDYAMKFVDPKAQRRERVEGIKLDDTELMKTLDDMRKVLIDPVPVRWKLVG